MRKNIIRKNAYGPRIFRNAYNWVHRSDNIYYYPIYNVNVEMSNRKLAIYNEDGDPMDAFFIRDFHRASNPYWNNGRYFIWDRYNYGLDTHFYTHQAMVETMGKPARKYGMFLESREIAPRDYEIFRMNRGLEREFETIFTFDDRILNEVENARFYPVCAVVWCALDENAYQGKTKNLSIVSSDKTICDLHRFRIQLARECRSKRMADTFGTFDGGHPCQIEESLREYRYSIVIENTLSDYFFCEKITNCFATQTVPVYLGAAKIDEFFNSDGIIKIDRADLDRVEQILRQCTKEEYERRLPAILDNYTRVQEYRNMDDYLYRHYFLS